MQRFEINAVHLMSIETDDNGDRYVSIISKPVIVEGTKRDATPINECDLHTRSIVSVQSGLNQSTSSFTYDVSHNFMNYPDYICSNYESTRNREVLYLPLDYRAEAWDCSRMVPSAGVIYLDIEDTDSVELSSLKTMFNALHYKQRDSIKFLCEEKARWNGLQLSWLEKRNFDMKVFYKKAPDVFEAMVLLCCGLFKEIS